MSSNPKLDAALQVLKDAGHPVGAVKPPAEDGEFRIMIDGVFRTFEEVFEMAEEENHKPRKAARTGEYVLLTVAPKTRRGTLGDARVEYGRLEYLFHLDPRF